MDLLERIFGVETMARARAAAREAQVRANAAGAAGSATAPPGRRSSAASAAQSAATARPQVRRPDPPARDDAASAAELAADFPTSILETPPDARPPLLAAFASRDALLGAIVYAEALAPPVALR